MRSFIGEWLICAPCKHARARANTRSKFESKPATRNGVFRISVIYIALSHRWHLCVVLRAVPVPLEQRPHPAACSENKRSKLVSMNSWHVADQVWRELEFAFVFAFVVSCELIRLGWQESGCPLSQPGLLCFKEVGCL